jgi:hypothetical protein
MLARTQVVKPDQTGLGDVAEEYTDALVGISLGTM